MASPHPLQKVYSLLWEGCEAFKLASTYVRHSSLKQEFGAIGKTVRNNQDYVQLLLRKAERTPRVEPVNMGLFDQVQQRDRPLNDHKKDSQMVRSALAAIGTIREYYQENYAILGETNAKLDQFSVDLDKHVTELKQFQDALELDPQYPLPGESGAV